ncbi:DNA repair exonuclease [Aerococcaceae bacterium DSM 111022]|nr:DNA repair exonuclease [Aerococcaceae bacterium DSM 111022]
MKIMHLADLHLDSPFIGVSKHLRSLHHNLVNAPYNSFRKAVDIAINEELDAVVIAGDIYDANHQTIYAQTFLVREFERLNEAEIPVVMIHGNHDYLNDDKYQVVYPENVHEFTTQDVDYIDITLKNQQTARFYGFSYTQQWIQEDKVREYPVNPKATDYTIGLLHGDIRRGQDDNYAPFVIQELADKNYDYWALGHIHQNQILHEHPTIAYSGTIQGRHHNERGDKGAFIVEFDQGRMTDHRFVSLSEIVWHEMDVLCQADFQASDIVKAVQNGMANFRQDQQITEQSYILTVHLRDADLLSPTLQEQIENNELLQALETQFAESLFIAVRKVILESDIEGIQFEYDPKLDESFKQITGQMHEEAHYQQIMGEVFNHPIVRKWLPDLKEDEAIKDETIESAKQALNQQFNIAFEVSADED